MGYFQYLNNSRVLKMIDFQCIALRVLKIGHFQYLNKSRVLNLNDFPFF